MVSNVIQPHSETKIGNDQAWIVELVGPAGAGKTTLFRALAKNIPELKIEYLPPVRSIRYIHFFVKQILLLAPTLVRIRGKGDRNFTRRELAWMAMLLGWPKILKKKQAGTDNKIILLDQGPVFLMAILYEFGPECMRTPVMLNYWEKVFDRWVNTLDMVIWLDTSDEVLIKRIRNRPDEHIVKGKTDHEIIDFLEKYRRAYDRLIHMLKMKNREIRVLKIDSGDNPVDYLLGCIIQNLPHGIKFP